MATPASVDTPDYQRGVVSAQKLLATVPGGTAAATVGLPPNVETLVVVVPGFDLTSATCVGVTSNATYPGIATRTGQGAGLTTAMYFDVSAALDASVTVTAGAAPNNTWYIYGDSGVHITTDLGLDTTLVGAGYRGLNAVGTTALDPNVQNASPLPVVATQSSGQVACLTAGATMIVPAPAVGANYLFSMDVMPGQAAPNGARLIDHTTGDVIAYAGASGTSNGDGGHVELGPYRIAGQTDIYGWGQNGWAIVRYAPGP